MSLFLAEAAGAATGQKHQRRQRLRDVVRRTATTDELIMNDLQKELDDLTRRVQALEDELAIHRVIVRYGLAVDIGDADGAANTFTEDTVYDVDVGLMRGRDGVREMVRSERHQNMVGRCAHQIGPAVVEIHGDRATATGYSRVYLHKDGSIQVYRVSLNHWQLARRDGQWQIAHRTTRLLGHAEARRVFEDAPKA